MVYKCPFQIKSKHISNFDLKLKFLVVRRLHDMREVLSSNPLGGNILCSPSHSEDYKPRFYHSCSHDVRIDVYGIIIVSTRALRAHHSDFSSDSYSDP